MKTLTNHSLSVLMMVVTSFLCNSCFWKNDEVPVEENPTLISATKVRSITALELQVLIELSEYDIPSSAINNDVDVYEVTYHTIYKGSDITASGIVSIPNTQSALPMVSFQHGTIVAHDDAPTERSTTLEGSALFAALASPGFIAVIPDYPGFGSSTHILHPYYIEEYLALAVIDNLKAARELAEEIGATFNGDLYLGGYSEGGYVTMATHKSIEENGLEGFNLAASFPAAGGYDVKAVQEYLFTLDIYSDPYYLAYIALAYKTTYDWSQSLTDFFNQPYADSIPDLFDGSKSGGEINSFLTDTLSVFVNPDLIDSIDISTRYQYIVDALTENTLTDWTPTVKMYMYHGDADVTVPYQNSVSSHQHFLANGASPETVELITLQGSTHSSGVKPYVEDFVEKLLSLSATVQ